MFTVVYDAVRIAEREARSAMPDAPVVNLFPKRAARRDAVRLTLSRQLRRMADVLEPERSILEPSFTRGAKAGC